MKASARLCVSFFLMTSAASALQRAPHLNVVHRQVDAGVLVKRGPEPQFDFPSVTFDFPGNTRTNTATQTQTTTTDDDDNSTSTSSTSRETNSPTNTRTNTRSTTSTPTSTSTSTSTTSTSSTPTTTSTSTTSSVVVVTTPRASSATNTGTTLSINNVAASRSIRSTSTSESPTATSSSSTPFSKNKAAITATAVIASIAGTAVLAFIGFWLWRKSNRGKMGDDTWDVPAMNENNNRPSSILPPPVSTPGKAVLPSQSLGASGLARSRSNYTQPAHRVDRADEPDEIMSLPPVANYDRPRDSAFDIVPAAPPTAYYSNNQYGARPNVAPSNNGGLAVPRNRGQLTSFGSDVGGDPFAGSGPMEGERESMYGAGQAGRGAGFNMMGNTQPATGYGGVGLGSQWPQGYNQYTGYSQGYGGPYGYSS
ncbi:hypothetical protein CPB86DRAFT_791446 [Serendipita vermifera]|nr:hypothetical protein CPB86DRAFT_791446 [Serendipita vermifera]